MTWNGRRRRRGGEHRTRERKKKSKEQEKCRTSRKKNRRKNRLERKKGEWKKSEETKRVMRYHDGTATCLSLVNWITEEKSLFLSSLCVYFYLSLSICTISWFRVVTILQNLHGICIVIIIMILSSHPPLLFVLFVSLLSWVMIHHPPLLRLHIIIINMPFANIYLYAYKKPYHLAFQSIPSFLHREKYPYAWHTIALNGKNQQRKEEFKWMHEYMHEYVRMHSHLTQPVYNIKISTFVYLFCFLSLSPTSSFFSSLLLLFSRYHRK